MVGTIGEIRMYAGNTPPANWKFCNGDLLPVASYPDLYAVIGINYGGVAGVTCGLPDLRSRTAMGAGSGPGLPYTAMYEKGGIENITLTVSNIPSHTHTVSGQASILMSSGDGHTANPTNDFPAVNGANIYGPATDNSSMAPASLNLASSPQAGNGTAPINNLQPYLATNFIICVLGTPPYRN